MSKQSRDVHSEKNHRRPHTKSAQIDLVPNSYCRMDRQLWKSGIFSNKQRYFSHSRARRRAASRASPQSPAVADRAADRTRAPRLVTRPLTRSGPDSALVEAPFEPAKCSYSDASRFSPRANADASHGRAVLRVARRARRGRVRTVALVPAKPRRVERPQEPGRRAQRQAGDEVDGPSAVPRGAQRSRARSVPPFASLARSRRTCDSAATTRKRFCRVSVQSPKRVFRRNPNIRIQTAAVRSSSSR